MAVGRILTRKGEEDEFNSSSDEYVAWGKDGKDEKNEGDEVRED